MLWRSEENLLIIISLKILDDINHENRYAAEKLSSGASGSSEKAVKPCDELSFLDLRRAMESTSRCPICVLIEEIEERYFRNLLYENVNNPSVRENIRKSLGFCPYHAYRFSEFIKRSPEINGLGASIIYLDMLNSHINDLFKDPGELWSRCILCSHVRDFEEIYVYVLVKCIDQAMKTYENSHSILCQKHLLMITSSLDETRRNELTKIHRDKLRRLVELTESFIRKHDYKSREPITDEESNAWRNIIYVLKGSLSHRCPRYIDI
jgi:hypothetical protein